MSIKIRPYKIGSASAKLLADAMSELLGKKVLRTVREVALRRHSVINWGGTSPVMCRSFINKPMAVAQAINKHTCLSHLTTGQVETPDWSTRIEDAKQWIREGHKVYCRTIIDGREGKGIVVAKTENELVDAPLYTKRFKNGREYRVHVAFGKVIQVVQKKRRRGSNASQLVRSNNAFVFARNLNHDVPECVKEHALKAISVMGLDFGAVDVVYSVANNKACVLEINTAPGVDATSARLYATSFVEHLNGAQ